MFGLSPFNIFLCIFISPPSYFPTFHGFCSIPRDGHPSHLAVTLGAGLVQFPDSLRAAAADGLADVVVARDRVVLQEFGGGVDPAAPAAPPRRGEHLVRARAGRGSNCRRCVGDYAADHRAIISPHVL